MPGVFAMPSASVFTFVTVHTYIEKYIHLGSCGALVALSEHPLLPMQWPAALQEAHQRAHAPAQPGGQRPDGHR